MTTQAEITITEFVDSIWFKALARGGAMLGSLLAMGIGVYFFALGDRVAKIEQDRAVKLIEYSNRIEALGTKLDTLQGSVSELAADTASTRQDTALMRGILTQMQRQQTLTQGQPAAMLLVDPASP